MDQKATHSLGALTPARTETPAAAPNGRRTSVLLRKFLETQTADRISLGALRDALGDRGFGVLLLIFALPNLVPLNIPLLSAVLGFPLVLLGAQLAYGRRRPWFPDWIKRRSFPRASFEAVVSRTLPALERAERLFRPRLTWLLSWTGERAVGTLVLFLALILTLPIPFANWCPPSPSPFSGSPSSKRTASACLSAPPLRRRAWSWPGPSSLASSRRRCCCSQALSASALVFPGPGRSAARRSPARPCCRRRRPRAARRPWRSRHQRDARAPLRPR
nr:exopolysaccharide biosynthesis protein [Methyloceanibacter marginalis]